VVTVPDRLVVVGADVSIGNVLSAIGLLSLVALAVGGLAVLLHRLIGRHAP